MNFTFVFVDDEATARRRVRRAVEEHNRHDQGVHLAMREAKDPEELSAQLDSSVDLVLADVFWKKAGAQEEDKLNQIINAVKVFGAETQIAPIPLIAYTGHGRRALDSCLTRSAELFDIWDKSTASPPYVTWRLSRLAHELIRLRPDSIMQRLVRGMKTGARWHKHVVDMTIEYSKGSSEYDQIERAGHVIENIAYELGIWNTSAEPMWKVMSRWEALSRAVSPTVRGHARHVINVFWLGYYLIHHEQLREWFENAWIRLVERRVKALEVALDKRTGDLTVRKMLDCWKAARGKNASQCLSDCWYYAGLFHDVAGCVQKYPTVRRAADGLVSELLGPKMRALDPSEWMPGDLAEKADQLFSEFTDAAAAKLRPLWQKSVQAGFPDHGVVAALYLREHVMGSDQCCYAHEAARAIAVHNLVGELHNDVTDLVTWDADPLVCLLLLCDQIQTWDRERGDETLKGPDGPDRAQLVELTIEKDEPRTRVSMCIDYIAPRHLDHDRHAFERVKNALEDTLKDKPNRALGRIDAEWPFSLEVKCRLSGLPLAHGLKFGNPENS